MEELDRLKNEPTLSEFQQTKFEREARKNWDLFYKRNQTNFFKDRHWTTREFEQLLWNQLDRPEENGAGESGAKELIGADAKLTLFELGCGVGNFFFPLLQTNANLTVYACDFSPRAVDLIRSNAAFDRNRCVPFVADLTDCDSFDEQLRINFDSNLEADLASLIFVLSAVAPCKMKSVLQNAFNVSNLIAFNLIYIT